MPGNTRKHIKKPAAKFNLHSPNGLVYPCDLADLTCWFRAEVKAVPDAPVRSVLLTVFSNLDHFVHFPAMAVLLWPGCSRAAEKYHRYPDILKKMVRFADLHKQCEFLRPDGKGGQKPPRRVTLDSRINGPAVAAFEFAGGERPGRFGSMNRWSVHHLYSGKFPYPGQSATLHAAKHNLHFTQSAGLVAIHPIADQMCDEFPCFAWLLRAQAFQRFGYDPDEVLSSAVHDDYGFAGKCCFVVPNDKLDE